MAITELIATDTAAADAALEISGNIVLVATKLGKEEYVFIHVYGNGGDTEVMAVLSNRKNSVQLVGPCKYHVYKDVTGVSLGVGYYA